MNFLLHFAHSCQMGCFQRLCHLCMASTQNSKLFVGFTVVDPPLLAGLTHKLQRKVLPDVVSPAFPTLGSITFRHAILTCGPFVLCSGSLICPPAVVFYLLNTCIPINTSLFLRHFSLPQTPIPSRSDLV